MKNGIYFVTFSSNNRDVGQGTVVVKTTLLMVVILDLLIKDISRTIDWTCMFRNTTLKQ